MGERFHPTAEIAVGHQVGAGRPGVELVDGSIEDGITLLRPFRSRVVHVDPRP